MTRRVRLSRLKGELSDLSYPISRGEVVEACGDVRLLLADGEADLAPLLADADVHRYESRDDLHAEVLNRLPRRAVGEPFQSEGEG